MRTDRIRNLSNTSHIINNEDARRRRQQQQQRPHLEWIRIIDECECVSYWKHNKIDSPLTLYIYILIDSIWLIVFKWHTLLIPDDDDDNEDDDDDDDRFNSIRILGACLSSLECRLYCTLYQWKSLEIDCFFTQWVSQQMSRCVPSEIILSEYQLLCRLCSRAGSRTLALLFCEIFRLQIDVEWFCK